jgi:hypothetical protein
MHMPLRYGRGRWPIGFTCRVMACAAGGDVRAGPHEFGGGGPSAFGTTAARDATVERTTDPALAGALTWFSRRLAPSLIDPLLPLRPDAVVEDEEREAEDPERVVGSQLPRFVDVHVELLGEAREA